MAVGATLKILLKQVPKTRVLSLRGKIASYPAQRELWDELRAFAGQHDIAPVGPAITIYHDQGFRESDIDTQVCLPVAADAVVPPTPEQRILVTDAPPLPRAATATITGPASAFRPAYAQLFGWIHEHNEEVAGPVREVCLAIDTEQQDSAEGPVFVTELQVPLQ